MADGNSAAMRKALEDVRDDLWDLMGSSSESRQSIIACEMSRKIRAALSTPPRNCDRFNTGDVKRDAQDAMEAILHEGVAGYRGIAEYLLSPVRMKQEGDDNGSK